MDDTQSIRTTAGGRGRAQGLPYAGAVTPVEAFRLMQAGARLVDVRTKPELHYVGRIPGAVAIEWQTWPGSQPNPGFLAELAATVGKDEPVLFLCRSGSRSHFAAIAAAQQGWTSAFNVLEGFEGVKDPHGHRNTVNGWRMAGLPWTQS